MELTKGEIKHEKAYKFNYIDGTDSRIICRVCRRE